MQAKGRPFKVTIDFILEKYGNSKLDSFFEKFPSFRPIPSYSDIDWYSMEELISFSDSVDKFFGFGDSLLLFDIGKFSAEKAMDGSHKLFRNSSPSAILSNAQALFSSYYSGGLLEAEPISDNRAKLTLKDFPAAQPMVKRIQGWISGCLSLTGARHPVIKDSRAKPGSVSFIVEWE